MVHLGLAQIIGLLVNFDTFEKPPRDTKNMSRRNVAADEMVKLTYVKNKFSQPNDKNFTSQMELSLYRFII